MKKIVCASLFLFALTLTLNAQKSQKSFYDFTVTDINGKSFHMSSLKGKKVMIVNVASKCGYTPQYEELQKLYDTYKDKNFVIVAFPANNFANQEPGTNAEIKEFCTVNYGVTFPMMQKISVKGEDQATIYKWLTQKTENGVLDRDVMWNFQKYLINENGKLTAVYLSKTSPLDEKIINWIEQ